MPRLVTDLQYARSEAARRNRDVRVGFQASDTLSCYVLYVEPEVLPVEEPASQASTAAPAAATAVARRAATCAPRVGREEIKTVQVPQSTGRALQCQQRRRADHRFRTGFWRPGAVQRSRSAPGAFEVLVSGTPRGQAAHQRQCGGTPQRVLAGRVDFGGAAMLRSATAAAPAAPARPVDRRVDGRRGHRPVRRCRGDRCWCPRNCRTTGA